MGFRAIKAAFNNASSWGLIDKSPFAGVKQLRVPKMAPVFFPVENFVARWRVIPDAEFKMLIAVAILTMLRRGDPLNLTWDDVDFGRRVRNKKGSQ